MSVVARCTTRPPARTSSVTACSRVPAAARARRRWPPPRGRNAGHRSARPPERGGRQPLSQRGIVAPARVMASARASGCSGGPPVRRVRRSRRFGISPTAVTTTGRPLQPPPSGRPEAPRSARAARRDRPRRASAARRSARRGTRKWSPEPERGALALEVAAQRALADKDEAHRYAAVDDRLGGPQAGRRAPSPPEVGHRQRQQLAVGQTELLAHLSPEFALAVEPASCTGSISIPWITTCARRRRAGGSDSFAASDTISSRSSSPMVARFSALTATAILSHMQCSVYTSAGRRRGAAWPRPGGRGSPRRAGANARCRSRPGRAGSASGRSSASRGSRRAPSECTGTPASCSWGTSEFSSSSM